MIDTMKSLAIVSLLWLNAALIVTGCNLIGTSAVAVQMQEKEQIVRQQDAAFEAMQQQH